MSELRMVTWNLRYDAKPDNVTVAESIKRMPDALEEPSYLKIRGEQPWSIRRIRVAQCLLAESPVIAGTQHYDLAGICVTLLHRLPGGTPSPSQRHEGVARPGRLGLCKFNACSFHSHSDEAQIGVGRDDGRHAGEFCPIFYDKFRSSRANYKPQLIQSS